MIIDTHSQLWTKEAIESFPEKMAAGYRAMFKDLQFPEIEDTLQDMDAAGVDRAVIVAIDAETVFHYRVSNDLVAEMVNKYPDRFIGFASVDPNKGKKAAKELRRSVEELKLKGLKLLPHLIEMYPSDKAIYPLYEIAVEYNLPVLFHSGTQFHSGTRIKYCQPLYIDDVAVDFPELKIVIAHFGFPWFHEAMAIVLRNQSVFFNIAGWAPKYIPQDVLQAIRGQLRHKVLFGSDYPLLSRVRIVNELKELDLDDETRMLLMTKNPKRLLNIS